MLKRLAPKPVEKDKGSRDVQRSALRENYRQQDGRRLAKTETSKMEFLPIVGDYENPNLS